MEIYKEYGVSSGLVSLGGNVSALGLKPDETKWRIAIQDPEDGELYVTSGAASDFTGNIETSEIVT